MDQIVTVFVVSYGTTYLVKYGVEYMTSNIIKKTTNKAKKIVTNMIYTKPKKNIEYQLINLDENNQIIFDEVVYVTSYTKDKSKDVEFLV